MMTLQETVTSTKTAASVTPSTGHDNTDNLMVLIITTAISGAIVLVLVAAICCSCCIIIQIRKSGRNTAGIAATATSHHPLIPFRKSDECIVSAQITTDIDVTNETEPAYDYIQEMDLEGNPVYAGTGEMSLEGNPAYVGTGEMSLEGNPAYVGTGEMAIEGNLAYSTTNGLMPSVSEVFQRNEFNMCRY